MLAQHFFDFYWILFGWFINLNVEMFQPLIVIYRRDDFVYNHWKCTTIYRPLSYAYRCLAWLCVCARLSVCLCACLLLCLSVCLSVWLSVMAVVKLFNRRRFYVCVWLYFGIILNKISMDYFLGYFWILFLAAFVYKLFMTKCKDDLTFRSRVILR